MICWKNKEWQLTGVTSWGNTICATKGLPGVYPKVSYYRYWIDEQVAKVSMFGLSCGFKGTAKRKLERLQFSTSSSFVKI